MKLINLSGCKTGPPEPGIDVFAPKYRACSRRYKRQGLERWKEEHPEEVEFADEAFEMDMHLLLECGDKS